MTKEEKDALILEWSDNIRPRQASRFAFLDTKTTACAFIIPACDFYLFQIFSFIYIE